MAGLTFVIRDSIHVSCFGLHAHGLHGSCLSHEGESDSRVYVNRESRIVNHESWMAESSTKVNHES